MAQFKHANTYKEAADQYAVTEWLSQLAEEASELAQAALKFRRSLIDDGLWTPAKPSDLTANLIEEFADVKSCIENVIANEALVKGVLEISKQKSERFVQRHNEHRAEPEQKA